MGVGSPLPVDLPKECRKAAKIFSAMASPSNGIDRVIPTSILRGAHGFALFTVMKAGFIFSARAGSGLVIARLPNGGWSAPSAIGTAGLGFGGQLGAEVTEFIVVLNSKAAVRQFMSAGSVSLGGNMSVAVGPLGRNAEGTGAVNSKGNIAAMYSYSRTAGLFGGISVEGSVLVEREDCNRIAYGDNVTATQLLSGRIEVPSFAQPLIDVLNTRAGGSLDYDPDPTVLGGGGWKDEDSQPGTPSAYEFGSENPFASAGVGGKKPRPKRGMSVGSWKGSPTGSGGYTTPEKNRSRNNTVTAWDDDYAPLPGQASPTAGRSRSGTLGRRFDPPSSSPLAGGSPARESPISSRANQGGPFRGGKVAQETTPILEDDRFDFSAARDALSSDSEDNASRPSFDSFDGSRKFQTETAAPLSSSKKKSPPSTKPYDDLITFSDRPSAASYRDYEANDFDYPTRSSPSASGKERDDPFSNYHSSPPKPKPKPARKSSGARALPNDFVRSRSGTIDGDDNLAVALWDFAGQQDGDLSFKKGDVIIITKTTDDQWWTGRIGGRLGIFPLTHVKLQG